MITANPKTRGILNQLIPVLITVWPCLASTASAAAVGTLPTTETVTISWNPNPEPAVTGYNVYLGTGNGYSVVHTVDGETSILLSDLAPGATYFCAVQAFYSDGTASELSEEISFSTRPDGEFGEWTFINGISRFASLPSSTPHGDGVPNLLKYAFNMDATGPDVRSLRDGEGAGLPVFSIDASSGQPVFKVEYLRRPASGLIYTPKFSTNLSSYSAMTGSTTVTALDPDWELVRVAMPINPAVTPKLFGRVEVTLP